ncbi:MAG: hypothetical protein HQK54_04845 [Oligoflexales bacterium]|nr:hypothetical protein [Oligoflexales bacterium]
MLRGPILSILLFSVATIALGENQKERSFLFHGVFTPSFGELAIQPAVNKSLSLSGKFGIQFVRLSDYFSFALGFGGVGISSAAPYYGINSEFIFFPAFPWKLSLGIMPSGAGSTKNKTKIPNDNKIKNEKYDSSKPEGVDNMQYEDDVPQYIPFSAKEVVISILYALREETSLFIGAGVQTVKVEGNSAQQEYLGYPKNSTTFLIGIRGSTL